MQHRMNVSAACGCCKPGRQQALAADLWHAMEHTALHGGGCAGAETPQQEARRCPPPHRSSHLELTREGASGEAPRCGPQPTPCPRLRAETKQEHGVPKKEQGSGPSKRTVDNTLQNKQGYNMWRKPARIRVETNSTFDSAMVRDPHDRVPRQCPACMPASLLCRNTQSKHFKSDSSHNAQLSATACHGISSRDSVMTTFWMVSSRRRFLNVRCPSGSRDRPGPASA